MADNHVFILDCGYYRPGAKDRTCLELLCYSENDARRHIDYLISLGRKMIYAKIRKFRFVQDICLKYDDKGELENEFYINPNKT